MIPVTLGYAPHRVDCSWCGIRVESLPWTLPENLKSPLTETYAWYLAGWAKRLSWLERAEAFKTTWDTVCQAVFMAVSWGLAHRSLSLNGPTDFPEEPNFLIGYFFLKILLLHSLKSYILTTSLIYFFKTLPLIN